MRFPLKLTRPRPFGSALSAIASLSALALSGSLAAAESAYIKQASSGSAAPISMAQPIIAGRQAGLAMRSDGALTATPLPELTTPRTSGTNFAQSVTIGNFNAIAQLQAGKNDLSSVSVLGGNRNNVGVLQGGNNLVSNIALLGTQGLNVAVLQPTNSAPVDMLIARLPNGALLIRR